MRTVRQLLGDLIRTSLNPADSLIVEHNHLAAYSDGAAGEGKQRHSHIALPQMTDEIDFSQDCQWLHAWFYL